MTSIHEEYATKGVDAFYREGGATYTNPHESIIHECLNAVTDQTPKTILDLACGSGEITIHFPNCKVTGLDPYTGDAYFNRTGKRALPYTFADIASGALMFHQYDLIICSFALHLAEQSRLPGICLALSQISPKLLILTPHKRPHIQKEWGWQLIDECVIKRVRSRWYKSLCERPSYD